MGTVARDAKAEDDFVLILIGHGSFDGVEYKFNLVGPDVTAAQIAAMCDRIAARRQLVVDTTSASGGAVQASSGRARGDRRHEIGHGEERHRIRALLGRGASGSRRGHRQERFHQRNGSVHLRHQKDRGLL